MASPDYARLITEHQRKIYGYIYSLVGNSAASWDVLQESNLVLWRKQSEFVMGTNFQAWAFSIARFQVMAFLRDRKRDPLEVLTPELVEVFAEDMAEDMEKEAETFTQRLSALEHCRGKLKGKHRDLIRLYYEQEIPIKTIAATFNLKANAVKQMMLRIRRNLQNCIDLRIQKESP